MLLGFVILVFCATKYRRMIYLNQCLSKNISYGIITKICYRRPKLIGDDLKILKIFILRSKSHPMSNNIVLVLILYNLSMEGQRIFLI